jgi:hypothetical protein
MEIAVTASCPDSFAVRRSSGVYALGALRPSVTGGFSPFIARISPTARSLKICIPTSSRRNGVNKELEALAVSVAESLGPPGVAGGQAERDDCEFQHVFFIDLISENSILLYGETLPCAIRARRRDSASFQ